MFARKAPIVTLFGSKAPRADGSFSLSLADRFSDAPYALEGCNSRGHVLKIPRLCATGCWNLRIRKREANSWGSCVSSTIAKSHVISAAVVALARTERS